MKELIRDPGWMIPVVLGALGLVLGAIPLVRNRRAKRIEGAIANFLIFLQGHRIWREGEADRFRAEPEKMEASAYEIREKLGDAIGILSRDNYAHLPLLRAMQRGCNEFLNKLAEGRRQAPSGESPEELFDRVLLPALGPFAGVIWTNSHELCTKHNLCERQELCEDLC